MHKNNQLTISILYFYCPIEISPYNILPSNNHIIKLLSIRPVIEKQTQTINRLIGKEEKEEEGYSGRQDEYKL